MKRREIYLALSGWIAVALLAFCTSIGDNALPDGATVADAIADEDATDPTASLAGLWVVDADGKAVGTVVSRTHPLKENSELLDAVMVYNPTYRIFFTVEMNSGDVILPAKVFYPNGNCSGEPAIKGICPDCLSGSELGVRVLGRWYQVTGGVEREPFHYSSYFTEGSQGNCVGHGGSDTYVYPLTELPEGGAPGEFNPPLRFSYH